MVLCGPYVQNGGCRNVVQIPTRESVSVMGMCILPVFIWTSAGSLSSQQESTCCYCMILHSLEGTWNKVHLLYTGPRRSSSPCKQQHAVRYDMHRSDIIWSNAVICRLLIMPIDIVKCHGKQALNQSGFTSSRPAWHVSKNIWLNSRLTTFTSVLPYKIKERRS